MVRPANGLLILLVACAAAASGYYALTTKLRQRPLPDAVLVVPSRASFGTVHTRGEVQGEFELFNNSPRTVTVLDVTASCGCAAVELTTKQLPPGARCRGRMKINLKGRYGDQRYQCRIVTDEPFLEPLTFTLSGEVLDKELGEIPFDLGQFPPDVTIREEIRLAKNGYPMARLIAANLTCDAPLVASFDADNTDPEHFHIQITGRTPSKKGPFQGTINVSVRNGPWETARLTVRGNVQSVWEVPADLYLGFVPPGQSVTKELIIKNRFAASRNNPVAVKASAGIEIETGRPWLACDKQAAVGGGAAVVLLKATHPGNAQRGNSEAVLTLRLPSSKAESTEIRDVSIHAVFE